MGFRRPKEPVLKEELSSPRESISAESIQAVRENYATRMPYRP